MVDKKKKLDIALRSRDITAEMLMEYEGWSRATAYRRKEDPESWSVEEIEVLRQYNFTTEDLISIFF